MLTIKKKLAPTWFKLPGEDPAPEFLLAPLTAGQFIDARNEMESDGEGDLIISGRGVTDAVLASVRDWRNVLDETGAHLAFSREHLSDLQVGVQLKLAVEIVKRAALWESERKNSQSPST